MTPLTRIQILCFLRFSMPKLLIGIVIAGYSIYGLVNIVPTPDNAPWRPLIDPYWAFGLGTLFGTVLTALGIRSGLASTRYDAGDSDDIPADGLRR